MERLSKYLEPYRDDMDHPLGGKSLVFEGDVCDLRNDVHGDAVPAEVRQVVFLSTSFDNADLSFLRAFSQLESVQFIRCQFSDAGRTLATLPSIEELVLDRCLGRIRLDSLSNQSTTLKNLDIYSCDIEAAPGIGDLVELQFLRFFTTVSSCPMPMLGSKYLQDLKLGGSGCVIDVSQLVRCHSLTQIALIGEALNPTSLVYLKHLRYAYLEDCRRISVLQRLVIEALLPGCFIEWPPYETRLQLLLHAIASPLAKCVSVCIRLIRRISWRRQ